MRTGTFAATTLGDAMSSRTGGSHAAPSKICRALAILAEVTAAEASWPKSAAAGIKYKVGELEDILAARDRLVNGEMDPLAVLAPDMGFWSDPEVEAREYLDDEALETAKGLRRRLDEGLRDEKNSSKEETA